MLVWTYVSEFVHAHLGVDLLKNRPQEDILPGLEYLLFLAQSQVVLVDDEMLDLEGTLPLLVLFLFVPEDDLARRVAQELENFVPDGPVLKFREVLSEQQDDRAKKVFGRLVFPDGFRDKLYQIDRKSVV